MHPNTYRTPDSQRFREGRSQHLPLARERSRPPMALLAIAAALAATALSLVAAFGG